MEVIPGIDLRWGRCVRLYQGDFKKETVFSDDPLGVAHQWQELGAPRLHIVDLDGAQKGEPVNLGVINGIVALVDIPVQVGGGIRSFDTAAKLLDMGVQRVVLGTAAIQNPKLVERLCKRFGSQAVVVSVDARDRQVAVRGWTEATTIRATELALRMAGLGVQRFLYTDITRDGTLTEPNFEAIHELVRETGSAILAGGGIASLEHLKRLAALGVEGAVVGRALYTGDIKLDEAIQAVG